MAFLAACLLEKPKIIALYIVLPLDWAVLTIAVYLPPAFDWAIFLALALDENAPT